MSTITVQAPAKLNLTLDVLSQRSDGYHEMKMVMQSVSLFDVLTLHLEAGRGIKLTANLPFLPTDGRNLAVKAARVFQETAGTPLGRVSIHIEKTIPICAGMAGGSSDAAAVLRGLNELCGRPLSVESLMKAAERVGADVPYCVRGGTMLAEGKGEILTVLPPLPMCWAVIAKPGFPIATPELFHQIDGRRLRCRPDTGGVLKALADGDLGGVSRRMFNVFEEVLPPNRQGRVEELKRTLLQYGALGASMTGTGPTVFGLFDQEKSARTAYDVLRSLCADTFLVTTL